MWWCTWTTKADAAEVVLTNGSSSMPSADVVRHVARALLEPSTNCKPQNGTWTLS